MDVITLNSSGGGNRLSHQQIDQLASGGAKLKMPRVIGFGTPRSMKLSPDERRALEDAKRSGYYYAKPDKVATLWGPRHCANSAAPKPVAPECSSFSSNGY